MRRYRITQYCIVLGLILYPLIAYSTIGLPQRELFPFFSWDLFSHIPPKEITSFGIRFTSANGNDLPEPLYFEDAKGLTVASDDVSAFVTIQVLAHSVESADQQATTETQRLLESTYFGTLSSAEYELVRRRFDLLERWRENKYQQEDTIANFSFPQNPHQ